MKRTAISFLFLIVISLMFCACDLSENIENSFSERNSEIAEFKSPITMIIEESSRAAQAFGENCFYASDLEGTLFRVVYSDLVGLNEGDTVTVEFTKSIKELDVNVEGGYTPRYEIEATNVSKE